MDLLNYVIPFATIVMSYVFGRIQQNQASKKSALKERYEAFYVPFVSALYRGALWTRDLSACSLEARSVFFDLIFHNVQYIDEKTQLSIPSYYASFLDMMEHDNGNAEFIDAPKNYDAIFSKLVSSVLLESIRLSKQLHLPKLGKCAESMFSQSQVQQQK